MAPLAAEWAARSTSPTSAATDDMFMTDPPPASFMAGMACFIPRKVPRTQTSITRSYSSSVVVIAVPATPTPALLTMTSRPPPSETAPPTAAPPSPPPPAPPVRERPPRRPRARAGVVGHDVQAPPLGDRPPHERLDVPVPRDVGLLDEGPAVHPLGPTPRAALLP